MKHRLMIDCILQNVESHKCLEFCFVIRTQGRKSNMEEVQDELAHRLTLGRSAQKKFPAPPRSSNLLAANISYDSTSEEVRTWLEVKGFSTV